MFVKSKIPLLGLICLIIASCTRDCGREVVGMDLQPVTKSTTTEKAHVGGYYISDTLSGSIRFLSMFTHQGAGDFCDYFWTTYPVEDGMRLFAADPIVLGGDSLSAGEEITDYFEVTNLEEDFVLKYLMTSQSSVPESGEYEIIGELELDNGDIIRDRVVIKMTKNTL